MVKSKSKTQKKSKVAAKKVAKSVSKKVSKKARKPKLSKQQSAYNEIFKTYQSETLGTELSELLIKLGKDIENKKIIKELSESLKVEHFSEYDRLKNYIQNCLTKDNKREDIIITILDKVINKEKSGLTNDDLILCELFDKSKILPSGEMNPFSEIELDEEKANLKNLFACNENEVVYNPEDRRRKIEDLLEASFNEQKWKKESSESVYNGIGCKENLETENNEEIEGYKEFFGEDVIEITTESEIEKIVTENENSAKIVGSVTNYKNKVNPVEPQKPTQTVVANIRGMQVIKNI